MEKHADPPHVSSPNTPHFDALIGESAPMQCLRELIKKASQSACPVLIVGETGTGKELVARAIHFAGTTRVKLLITVDCSALTPTLIESELFGHVKGAFTGADRPRVGLFQTANDGTIFLDEIAELPLCSQAKLLRALQEREIRPVGSTQQVQINARAIAATNRDLEMEVQAGTFRQDLYFRLNVIQIRVPPLRERRADIRLLVDHFLRNFSDPAQPVFGFAEKALELLEAYSWPGNIRELENTIECAIALSSSTILTAGDLPTRIRGAAASCISRNNDSMRLGEIERCAIARALEANGGDKREAAHQLGIGKNTLYRKLKKYAGDLKSADKCA